MFCLEFPSNIGDLGQHLSTHSLPSSQTVNAKALHVQLPPPPDTSLILRGCPSEISFFVALFIEFALPSGPQDAFVSWWQQHSHMRDTGASCSLNQSNQVLSELPAFLILDRKPSPGLILKGGGFPVSQESDVHYSRNSRTFLLLSTTPPHFPGPYGRCPRHASHVYYQCSAGWREKAAYERTPTAGVLNVGYLEV